MCTATFFRLAQGFSLMLNRDTLAARPGAETLAQPVLEGASGPRRALFPVDPASHGTWLGLSDRGLAFALLDPQPGRWDPALDSRCRLIPVALAADSAIAGLERVAAQDLGRTAPFLLVGVDSEQAPLSLRWDGTSLERRLHEDGAQLWQCGQDEEAQTLQRSQFAQWVAGTQGADEASVLAAQDKFHRSDAPQPGPQAVWRSGGDVQTSSASQAIVLQNKGILRYLDTAMHRASAEAATLFVSRII